MLAGLRRRAPGRAHGSRAGEVIEVRNFARSSGARYRPGSVRPLGPGRGGRVTCDLARGAAEKKPLFPLPFPGPVPAPRCGG